MLDSLVPLDELDDAGADRDSPMTIEAPVNPFLTVQDPTEAALEAREAHKYLLAKAYFDTREYDRCSAVFIPPSTAAIPLSTQSAGSKTGSRMSMKDKGKSRTSMPLEQSPENPFPRLSQKALFLSLYAKYLAGEKRRDEETEMILGPADGGMTVNRELPSIAQGLEAWFADRKAKGLQDQGHGWLEYLYGVVLLKSRNDDEAKKWLIKSVHLNPFHWGTWQELNDLVSDGNEVSILHV